MKFSLLPCGLTHTQFFYSENVSATHVSSEMKKESFKKNILNEMYRWTIFK